MIADRPLPTTRDEVRRRGWTGLDVILVTGDAYVDHPSFGVALVGRALEAAGYRVGVIAQPDWRSPDDFRALGRPRLFVGVTAGAVDSLISNRTAANKPRRRDVYSPGGLGGRRPDRATIVYTNRIKQALGPVPVVIGGIEASLRRLAHYDWWQDRVRRSILLDSKADLLVYGMAEATIVEIADRLKKQPHKHALWGIPGTCYVDREHPRIPDSVMLPSYDAVCDSVEVFAEAHRALREAMADGTITLIQPHGRAYVVHMPPRPPATAAELDAIYELPFTRRAHPMYDELGGVPALETVRWSVTSHRGCFGGCSFCAIAAHQGNVVESRSPASIVREVEELASMPDFSGTITDVGGPTANMYAMGCRRKRRGCADRLCLYPQVCSQLRVDHRPYMSLLEKVRSVPGVKHVFVSTGVRHDLVLADEESGFLELLCEGFVSGQLKVAPEHVAPSVLARMRKPPHETFRRFVRRYREVNENLGKKQHLVTYFISAHPGAGLAEAVMLAEAVRDEGYTAEQIQDFTPTPMTDATCMFYTGIDPLSGERVVSAKGDHERKLQRALAQYKNPANADLVREALRAAGREDLIGRGRKCLVPPGGSGGPAHGKGRGRSSGGKRARRR